MLPLASTADALACLSTLASGLIYVSEADHELTVVHLHAGTSLEPDSILRALGKPAAAKLELMSVADFFQPATRNQPFHSAEDRAVVERYRKLVEFLTTRLADAQAVRVGTIEIDVYAVGRTSDGDWVGVATTVVET